MSGGTLNFNNPHGKLISLDKKNTMERNRVIYDQRERNVRSKWEKIFKDPMTTAAAIDRLVHHSVILELNVDSYRMEQAKKKMKGNFNVYKR